MSTWDRHQPKGSKHTPITAIPWNERQHRKDRTVVKCLAKPDAPLPIRLLAGQRNELKDTRQPSAKS